MKKDKFPSREEFEKILMKLKKEEELKSEKIYLGYLSEQSMKRKPRKIKLEVRKPLKKYS